MKKGVIALSALALSLGLVTAFAQESAPAGDAENTNLWFVELSGAPTADGNSLSAVRSEKAAFKRAATRAGVAYTERRSFDVLFNGYSVEVDAANRAKLARVEGVKALWPVETLRLPPVEVTADGAAPDLANAIAMTGADIVQNTLGFTGAGVKVAVMDTGVDYDHADLGGCFGPGCRVAYGYDFVGDAFNADPTSASYNPVTNPDNDPDDCNGHGTHVAGIVGASGDVTGVAPEVTFGAYRVFGCNGSTTADIMIAAMERALADGMQVLNMSIGSSFQWPQYPTAAASNRLVNKGVSVVASIGNSGSSGLYAAGAPGVGEKVIGVASFDNTHSTQKAFTIDPGNQLIGYVGATGAPPPPTSGTVAVSTLPVITGCNASDFAGFPAGDVALISRGICSFYVKSINAQSAGAAAVVLYNNTAGGFNPTVAGTPAVSIPVVAITQSAGQFIASLASPTLTWGEQTIVTAVSTGGLISGFSSYGLAADLSIKPDIGAPGGFIFSTYPLELGGYANISGTSMAAPHTAGAAALMLQAKPHTPSNGMRARLQNSADPKAWWGNPGLGFLDNVHRQGAGMLDIDDAILATTVVEPGKLALGETETGPAMRTLRVENNGPATVVYDLAHAPALATGANTFTPSFLTAFAAVSFGVPSVAVPAGGSATVDVTITGPATPAGGLYGGYLTLTPQGGGQVYRVPYAGYIGDYQARQVLTPTAFGFPWLAKLSGGSFFNQPGGATFSMTGGDIAYFLLHLDHQSRRVRMEAFDANTGKAWHRVSDDEYLPRNSGATSFFDFSWDGVTTAGKRTYTVPNGQYVVKVSVLKALGDESNPAHWETWTSPVITIARP